MNGGLEAAGDIATGALIGHAIDGEAAHAHFAHGPGVPHLCLNCGSALAGEFCSNCGQVAHIHRTLASIGHDLLHGVWHFEGKIWRTLPMLFTRPGQLTRRYVAGERARFVSPLALFLFSVFLMFATFSSIGGPIGGDNVQVNRSGKLMDDDQLTVEMNKAVAAEKALVSERAAVVAAGGDTAVVDDRLASIRDDLQGLNAISAIRGGKIEDIKLNADIETGIEAIDHRIAYAVKDPKLFFYKLQSNAYKYSWTLIPISLPFIWILFPFRRDVGPYDHAIFAIYSLSAMTLGAVVLSVARAIGLPGGMIATVFVLGPPLHMYKQLRGAYGVSRFGAVWRTFALLSFAAVAGLLFFATLLGLVV